MHSSSGIQTNDLVFERAKTVHALDRAATVIGDSVTYTIKPEDISCNVRITVC
jgi:hypothetical protein